MIYSKEKEVDIKWLEDTQGIAKIAWQVYKETGEEETLRRAEFFTEQAKVIKERINSDYTEKDKKRKKLDDIIYNRTLKTNICP